MGSRKPLIKRQKHAAESLPLTPWGQRTKHEFRQRAKSLRAGRKAYEFKRARLQRNESSGTSFSPLRQVMESLASNEEGAILKSMARNSQALHYFCGAGETVRTLFHCLKTTLRTIFMRTQALSKRELFEPIGRT